MKLPNIEIGFQVFASDRSEAIGAVRQIAPRGRPEIEVYIENGGEFMVPLSAIASVHDSKVTLDMKKLGGTLQDAIAKAHSGEQPGL